MTIQTLFHAIGWTCLAFGILGFIHLGIELWKTQAYTLGRAIIYCSLFGIGLALI